MSGKKCSQFRLKREREKKLRLIQGIENFHAEVINLEKRVGNLLGEASEGIRSTFGAEVQRAQNWLDRVDLPNIKKMGEKTNLGILRKTHTDLKQMATGGRQVQEELIVAFTQKADKMGQHLTRRLAEVENLLGSGQHLLELWFDDNQRAEWENALQEAHQFLVEEQYPPLTQLLDEIEKDLIAKIKWAEEQESKQQKRLYLLKALRQVCGEMGFEEIDAPHYENKGDRGSRILFTVDTLDRGRIKFTLSLLCQSVASLWIRC